MQLEFSQIVSPGLSLIEHLEMVISLSISNNSLTPEQSILSWHLSRKEKYLARSGSYVHTMPQCIPGITCISKVTFKVAQNSFQHLDFDGWL